MSEGTRRQGARLQAIRSFHNEIRKLAAVSGGDEQCDVGWFKLSQIANIDQTPLPFSFTSGDTYTDTREKSVDLCRSFRYGQASMHCSSDAVCWWRSKRVKPLAIFKGQGRRIPFILHMHLSGAHVTTIPRARRQLSSVSTKWEYLHKVYCSYAQAI